MREIVAKTTGLILGAATPRIAKGDRRPFVLGLSGPQGAGKSTLARALADRLAGLGLRAAVISLDDLYLTGAERVALVGRVHPLAATRGPPGTHDVGLGLALIAALGQEGEMRLPRFDKSLDDRAPRATWPLVATPTDVLVLEGWCLGAGPQTAEELVEPVNRLERDEDADGHWRRWVNGRLAQDYPALFAPIDFLALLRAPDFAVVTDWRREQERALRDSLGESGAAMSDAEVDRFVLHYQRLTEHLARTAEAVADLVIDLDARRRPTRALAGSRPSPLA